MSRVVGRLVCPKCQETKFLEGPHGAAAVNVKCAGCGYFMNISVLPRFIPGTDTIVPGSIWIVEERAT